MKLRLEKNITGHTIKGFWAIGMVERSPEQKIVILRVERRNSETLIPLILCHFDLKSTIYF